MENKKFQTIMQEAWTCYKKHWDSNLTYSLALFCFFAISIMLFLWLKIGFIIPFFFLILPLIYGLEMTIFLNAKQEARLPLRGYFLLSVSYYQRVFRSAFKGMRNFFIILGVSLLYLLLFSMLYCLVYAKNVSGFNEAVSTLENLFADENVSIEAIADFIAGNESLYPLFLYGLGGSYLFAIITFALLFRSMVMGARFRYLFPMLEKTQYSAFSKIVFTYYKKDYRRQYYESCFPLFIVLIGGYLAGFLIGNNLSSHYYVSIALGLSISSLLFSFYLPFFFCCLYAFEFDKEVTYWPIIKNDMEKSFEEALKNKDAKESDRLIFNKNMEFLEKEIQLYQQMIRMTPNSPKDKK